MDVVLVMVSFGSLGPLDCMVNVGSGLALKAADHYEYTVSSRPGDHSDLHVAQLDVHILSEVSGGVAAYST